MSRTKIAAATSRAVVCVLLATAAGCARNDPGDLLGSLIDQLPQGPTEYLKVAPVVVAATVLSNQETGRARNSLWTPNVLVVPHRVTCSLESVLRTDKVVEKTFIFTYYAIADRGAYQPYHKFFFQAEQRQRYIFMLIRQKGSLRSIGDVGNYTIPLYGGEHNLMIAPMARDSANDFGKRIALFLLTLGPGYDAAKYAGYLHRYGPIAQAIGSSLENFRMLKELENAAAPIKTSACFELNHYFWGQEACLRAIKDDPQQDESTRRIAADILDRAVEREKLLPGSLRDHEVPFSAATEADGSYQKLQILLEHPSAEIRQLACKTLRRDFRDSPAASNCSR